MSQLDDYFANIFSDAPCGIKIRFNVDDIPLVSNALNSLSNGKNEEFMQTNNLIDSRSIMEYKFKRNRQFLGLWITYLRNKHIYCSFCCRDNGTNLTTNQRIGISMIRLLITMGVTTFFYGYTRVRPNTTIGNWIIILLAALIDLCVILIYIFCLHHNICPHYYVCHLVCCVYVYTYVAYQN